MGQRWQRKAREAALVRVYTPTGLWLGLGGNRAPLALQQLDLHVLEGRGDPPLPLAVSRLTLILGPSGRGSGGAGAGIVPRLAADTALAPANGIVALGPGLGRGLLVLKSEVQCVALQDRGPLTHPPG